MNKRSLNIYSVTTCFKASPAYDAPLPRPSRDSRNPRQQPERSASAEGGAARGTPPPHGGPDRALGNPSPDGQRQGERRSAGAAQRVAGALPDGAGRRGGRGRPRSLPAGRPEERGGTAGHGRLFLPRHRSSRRAGGVVRHRVPRRPHRGGRPLHRNQRRPPRGTPQGPPVRLAAANGRALP